MKAGDRVILPADVELEINEERGTVLEVRRGTAMVLLDDDCREDASDDGLREVPVADLLLAR